MIQFFFGDVERPLYGVHHPPVSTTYRNSAVLICYPVGREYMRCHRAMVRLCDQLSDAGFHSLRFDYYGTGDSAGDGSDVTIDSWVDNTCAAAQELRDVSGARKVSLVGVRLGGAIAAYASARDRAVESLVLWDPITDGKRYLSQLNRMHKAFVSDLNRFPRGVAGKENTQDDELVGMPFPPVLRESIERISLDRIKSTSAERAAIVATEDRGEYRQTEQHFASLARSEGVYVIDEAARWDELADLGAVMLPHELLKKIVEISIGKDE